LQVLLWEDINPYIPFYSLKHQPYIPPFILRYHFEIILSIAFPKNLAGISPNVPAVYDVLPARIRKCVAFPGLTNCAGAMAWEWSVAQ
jgi:hypothetical protein